METLKNIFTALSIHIVIPAIGVLFFIFLTKKIKREQVPESPILELFILFATYGGLLILILTSLFWKWSGIASLIAFYLILIAPIVMVFLVFKMWKMKHISKYHNGILNSAIGYFIVTPILFLILFLLDL